MKVVKDTGLVPVKSQKTGAVFGVTPAQARKGLAEKKYHPVDIPDSIETIDVAGETVVETKIVVEDPVPEAMIDVPENWRELEPMRRVQLAKRIAPDFSSAGKSPDEEATRVIETYLDDIEDDDDGTGDERSASETPHDGGSQSADSASEVDIPENWKSEHHMTRISLAQKITGNDITLTDEQKAEGVKETSVADQIISDEVDRRKAKEPAA